ncbi:MAG: hypothetical protein HY882_02370 [Deltaproteobacteria bacterium]|nr:hypothetical protein [Deltaproteobacteria bacterium]
MRRLLLVLILGIFAVWGLTNCKPGLLPTEEVGKPKVTLDRVEVVGAFPWADLPARTPLVLGFVFNINNPSGYNVVLENFKFAFSFEVAKDKYIELNIPTVYDRVYFPAKTTSQYRVVSLVDSAVIVGKLAVAEGPLLQSLKLNPVDVIKDWYAKVGDFAFGIKVGEGQASFSTEKGDIIVSFEGKFPKR